MAINVNTLVPASLKSKNVATEQYVDTSIANIDVSGDINANNDVFAQKLGYASYAAMVNAAASGQTVINGGYINTGLIQAGAITADKINTNGLIAENIDASEIVGKTITGARINGAVIKASYLDLDGELEVLTNYHITVAMYDANPSLYTDAVYISADNEYRIPSISKVAEKTTPATLGSSNTTYYGQLSAYNMANNGNNFKAVKIRPTFENYSSNFLTMTGSNTQGSTIELRLGSLVVATITITGGKYWIKATISSNYTSTVSTTATTPAVYEGGNAGTYESTTASSSAICNNLPIFGALLIEVNATSANVWVSTGADNPDILSYGGTSGTIKISTIDGQYELPFNWDSSDKINIHYVSGFSATAKLSGIAIDNMV